MLALTWGGVAVSGRPTLDTRLLFLCLRDAEIVPGVTLRKVYRVLAWSFQARVKLYNYARIRRHWIYFAAGNLIYIQALASGRWPSADDEGRPLRGRRAALAGTPLTAGGHCGAWVEMRGVAHLVRRARNSVALICVERVRERLNIILLRTGSICGRRSSYGNSGRRPTAAICARRTKRTSGCCTRISVAEGGQGDPSGPTRSGLLSRLRLAAREAPRPWLAAFSRNRAQRPRLADPPW